MCAFKEVVDNWNVCVKYRMSKSAFYVREKIFKLHFVSQISQNNMKLKDIQTICNLVVGSKKKKMHHWNSDAQSKNVEIIIIIIKSFVFQG